MKQFATRRDSLNNNLNDRMAISINDDVFFETTPAHFRSTNKFRIPLTYSLGNVVPKPPLLLDVRMCSDEIRSHCIGTLNNVTTVTTRIYVHSQRVRTFLVPQNTFQTVHLHRSVRVCVTDYVPAENTSGCFELISFRCPVNYVAPALKNPISVPRCCIQQTVGRKKLAILTTFALYCGLTCVAFFVSHRRRNTTNEAKNSTCAQIRPA